MTAPRRKTSVMNHPVVITFLILAVVGAMSLAAEVLKPLALSVLLAFALTPVSRLLERRGIPKAVAVALTLVIGLGSLGGIAYVVAGQLSSLANELPHNEQNIKNKLNLFRPNDESAFKKATNVATDVARTFDARPLNDNVTDVRIIEQPKYRERLQEAVGPYIEFLGVGSFVLVLVLFMMLHREDLRDRVVSLFGHSRVSLTTRTMDEMGQRISRYLATFAAMNTAFGLVIGTGLWAIGVPYAVLWGCLAALTRFVPYVGPAVAFSLPLIYSFAHFESWLQPLEIIALFAVVETALNSFLEPVIYGKTTGISALGLLVAAMFWTWLWGLLGLLLSTPLTVCLAVLGKYVPSLSIFATLLGEEAEFDPDVRFYQRLVALDRDGAADVVDEALKSRPRVEVFDSVLVPALTRAERDAAEGFLEDRDLAFARRVVSEIIDELEDVQELTLASVAAKGEANKGEAKSRDVGLQGTTTGLVVGVADAESSDFLVLRMLAPLLNAAGVRFEVLSDVTTPLALTERLKSMNPSAVLLSHLPPSSQTVVRYQVHRLRAQFGKLPLLVGRWGMNSGANANSSKRLEDAGVTQIFTSVAEVTERLTAQFGASAVGQQGDAPGKSEAAGVSAKVAP